MVVYFSYYTAYIIGRQHNKVPEYTNNNHPPAKPGVQTVKEARLRVCNLASYTIERRKKVSATTYELRAFSNSSRQI